MNTYIVTSCCKLLTILCLVIVMNSKPLTILCLVIVANSKPLLLNMSVMHTDMN